MKRRARTPLDQAISRLQTNGIPYRLESNGDEGFLLFYGNVPVPQVYTADGKPSSSDGKKLQENLHHR